jgi:uncharacterized protein
MKLLRISLAIVLVALSSNVLFSQTNTHKIVFQLTTDDVKVHRGLIKQLNNLKNGWNDAVEMEVVCHGPGINFLIQGISTMQNEILALKSRGVIFIACENTLREKNIDKNTVIPNLNFVTMGIGEIVEKQEAGWSYIKAGF